MPGAKERALSISAEENCGPPSVHGAALSCSPGRRTAALWWPADKEPSGAGGEGRGVGGGVGGGIHLVSGIAALSSQVNECLFTVPGIKQACP